MKFYSQKIPGVNIIKPEPFVDSRGVFRRTFCKKEYKSQKLSPEICQCNISENKYRLTLRGFHYTFPFIENKTIICMVGAIYDIVVDLRRDSPTYLKWQAFELNNDNKIGVYIPAGCANALLTLKDSSIISYYHSAYYIPNHDRGIRYNDPLFKFIWPKKPQIISDKDRSYPDYIAG